MLFQNYALFRILPSRATWLSGWRCGRFRKAEIASRVEATLAMVRLSSFADRLPHQLSGGQQQRVGLARALIVEPSVLLLDEPFGALDKKLRESMQIEMRQLQQRLGITTLMVTHDQDEALTLSDRIAVMNNGRIEQIGTPKEIYEHPATAVRRQLHRDVELLPRPVTRREAALSSSPPRTASTLRSTARRRPTGPADVALRRNWCASPPRARRRGRPNRGAWMTVEQVVYHGINTHYLPAPSRRRAADRGAPERCRRQHRARYRAGSEVLASWQADRNRLVREDAA